MSVPWLHPAPPIESPGRRSQSRLSRLLLSVKRPCPFCLNFRIENTKWYRRILSPDKDHVDLLSLEDHAELFYEAGGDIFHKMRNNDCVYCDLVCRARDLLFPGTTGGVLIIFLQYNEGPGFFDENRKDLEYKFFSSLCQRQRPKEIPFAGDISPGAGSDQAFRFLRNCLDKCLREHPECWREHVPLPTRVLQIEGDRARVVQTNSTMARRYAALSHCWGKEDVVKLTRGSLESMQCYMPLNTFPPTYRDAILVCRVLGIAFLWIDSLCIIQDDEEDWEVESGNMAQIYENAYITIYAACCADPYKSFLAPGPRWGCYQHVLLKTTDEQSKPLVSARVSSSSGLHSLSYEPHSSGGQSLLPLERRAWALQERELARRLVIYTDEEIQWSCISGTTCECTARWNSGSISHIHSISARNRPAMDVMSQWENLVQSYTSCELTLSKDKLPALSGVATKLSQDLQLRYVAGLWEKYLFRQLLWRAVHGNTASQSYHAPTFSWASICDEVLFEPQNLKPQTGLIPYDKLMVEHVEITPKGKNKHGEIIHGRLQLYGQIIRCILRCRCFESPQLESIYGYSMGKIEEDFRNSNPYGRRSAVFWPDTALQFEEYAISPGEWSKTGHHSSNYSIASITRAPSPQHNELALYSLTGPVWLFRLLTQRAKDTSYDFYLVLGQSKLVREAYERVGLARFEYTHELAAESFYPLPWMSITVV